MKPFSPWGVARAVVTAAAVLSTPLLHAQSATWTKIILHVDNQECFVNFHRFVFIIENDTVVAIETVGTNGPLNVN